MCVEGETTITVENNTETMRMGETVLVPANAGKVVFKAQNAKILEVFISSKIKHVLQQAS